MTDPADSLPIIEEPEPRLRDDAAEVASLDSEIDFDDEQDDDQLPIDQVEAIEVGAQLDDPEELSEEDDED